MLYLCIAMLVNEAGVLFCVALNSIQSIKNRILLRKWLVAMCTQTILLNHLLEFQNATMSWLTALVVPKLFVNLAPIRKMQCLVFTAQYP